MGIDLVLTDTNVLILGLGGKEPYASYLRKLIENKRLVLSSVVVAEFLVRATDEEEKTFDSLVREFSVLPVDLSVAKTAADYRKKFMEKGKKLALPDCFIAATCKVNKVVLATSDKSGFPMKDVKIVVTF